MPAEELFFFGDEVSLALAATPGALWATREQFSWHGL